MTKHLLKAVGLAMLLMFTTGIVLPWIISTIVMPLWMIIFTLGAVIFLWVILLDRPFRKLINLAIKARKKEIKDDDRTRED